MDEPSARIVRGFGLASKVRVATTHTALQHPHCPSPPTLPFIIHTALHHPHCHSPPTLPFTIHPALHLPHCPSPSALPSTTHTALHHPHCPSPSTPPFPTFSSLSLYHPHCSAHHRPLDHILDDGGKGKSAQHTLNRTWAVLGHLSGEHLTHEALGMCHVQNTCVWSTRCDVHSAWVCGVHGVVCTVLGCVEYTVCSWQKKLVHWFLMAGC